MESKGEKRESKKTENKSTLDTEAMGPEYRQSKQIKDILTKIDTIDIHKPCLIYNIYNILKYSTLYTYAFNYTGVPNTS